MKGIIAMLALAALLTAVVGVSIAQAQSNDLPPLPPAGIKAVNGPNPGEVNLTWSAAAGANYYRIGWLADADYRAAGDDWLERFAFADVANKTAYTITRLTPGADYWFIVASNSARYGAPQWPANWEALRLNDDQSSCPTATPTEPAPTPAPTPAPAPAGDYDADNDGLIEISSLAQLDAIRGDLDGDGLPQLLAAYAAAYPNAMLGMGCPDGCSGYELTADLDFDTNGNGEADAGDAYWNDGRGWRPIGNFDHQFTAAFNGNGHTIANLYIARSDTDFVGLFGFSAYASTFRQVELVSVNVSGNDYVGGLVGYGRGAISNSYTTGDVSGDDLVGGLVGYAWGAISGSYAAGDASGDNFIGGLVGYARGAISGSYATGNVSGEGQNIGGLVGQTEGGSISASYATGRVSGSGSDIGGLVGENEGGAVSASYATGNVSGSGGDIGGLVGENEGGSISASYATGRVSGDGDNIGGLVGENEAGGSVAASYAVGPVVFTGETFYVGGLVGYNSGGATIASSYWDTQTTGLATSYGGTGKTTGELRSPAGYTGIYADWNLDLDDDGTPDDPWHFGTSRRYPALQYGALTVADQHR